MPGRVTSRRVPIHRPFLRESGPEKCRVGRHCRALASRSGRRNGETARDTILSISALHCPIRRWLRPGWRRWGRLGARRTPCPRETGREIAKEVCVTSQVRCMSSLSQTRTLPIKREQRRRWGTMASCVLNPSKKTTREFTNGANRR